MLTVESNEPSLGEQFPLFAYEDSKGKKEPKALPPCHFHVYNISAASQDRE